MLSQAFQTEINLIFQKRFHFPRQEQYENENLQTEFLQEQDYQKKKKVKTKKLQKNKNVNFGNIRFAYEIQQCMNNKHIVTKLQLLQEFKVG